MNEFTKINDIIYEKFNEIYLLFCYDKNVLISDIISNKLPSTRIKDIINTIIHELMYIRPCINCGYISDYYGYEISFTYTLPQKREFICPKCECKAISRFQFDTYDAIEQWNNGIIEFPKKKENIFEPTYSISNNASNNYFKINIMYEAESNITRNSNSWL